MSKPTPLEVSEACFRLQLASKAMDGFMCLLYGYSNANGSNLDAEEMAGLLAPIHGEIKAALDELSHGN